MVGRADVVRVESGGYRGTGFLVDGPDGGVYLVTTFHTFVKIGPAPVPPKDFVCTYWEDGKTWSETVPWDPINNPNLVDDWVVFRVHDYNKTKRWKLARALEPLTDDEDRSWSCYGFAYLTVLGIGASGTLTTTEGAIGPYAKVESPDQIPVLELLVDQMQSEEPVPASGFSGGPIVVGDRVVGVVRSFYSRGNEGIEPMLAEHGTVYANPIQQLAATLGWPCPQSWTHRDRTASELLVLPKPLGSPEDRLEEAPSELLRAQNQVVPFEGRADDLETLEALAAGDLPYHVFAAAGGSGKTRLLLEFCRRMRERDWIAGFVPNRPHTEIDRLVTTLTAGKAPRLLVFDYVETAPLLAAKVIAHAAFRALEVRVVMLSRDHLDERGPLWWKRLVETSGVPKHAGAWTQLPRMYEDANSRTRGFTAAVKAFLGEVPQPLPSLDADLLGRPLYLHGVALLCARDTPPDLDNLTEHGILSEILRHERAAWARWYENTKKLPTPTGFLPAMDAVISVSTLIGECPFDLVHGLAIGTLNMLDRGELLTACCCARDLYGEQGRPLEPDPLGEQLVAETLERGADAWLQLVAAPERTLAQLTRALLVLTRVADKREHTRPWLGKLLHEHGPVFVERIAKAAGDSGDEQTTQTEPPGLALTSAAQLVLDAPLAERLYAAIPEQTVELRELAVLALQQLVVAERGVDGDESRLAAFLNDLGGRLSELGDREQALEAAKEAVSIRRQLARTRPDAFLPHLAASLNNLGNRLSELGDHEQALEAAKEAVSIRRQLVKTRPDAFLPHLAASLNNLGNRLSEFGEREQALEAAKEAADIYRQLAKTWPNAFLPDLAMALNNLGTFLSELGDREQALEAAKEAADIYRQLAKTRPDAFLPDLAMALSNLGGRLSKLGDREQALEAAKEAADIYRQLAKTRPNAFLPDLAMALNNLGAFLSELGDREQALEAAKEAADIYRQLAKTRPDAFLPYLATSLNNLGAFLSELGDREQALEAAKEAVSIRRQLAKTRPDAFLPYLARALGTQGVVLHAAGQPDPAAQSFAEGLRAALQLLPTQPRVLAPLIRLLAHHYRQACADANIPLDEELAPLLAYLANPTP
ncbi:tetratricopeptide repeat protein [Pseudenhygromyxa sp. WMMC2535]|uniref:tetratricopeptide repeat protein n=1 Tax=Pseudenhygromyxa sp. WMMC2535 TaxID=2712867 RepID=UPI0015562F42|nr:tetratricopeptide repeat protein [Pseudenhygromyxa sp. WMMC2535]NVB36648.1 tetratricopeptide repeat protein [Pseudenhygromyxa sp. WMMC2535]